MKTDLEIAQEAKLLKINKVAEILNLEPEDYEPYGHYKAKLSLNLINKTKNNKDGKVILVTAINPTPAGEGKSTTTVGLTQAICKLGENAIATLREPSFGPVLGMKGGAAGGGFSQVVPMEEINLHFTGDIHAITTANNAISALIDNHIFQGNELNIDQRNIVWKRCLDMNDRSLRNIIVGIGGVFNGVPREDSFNITVASEIMAVLCLSVDLDDLKERISNMIIAYTFDKKAVTVNDLGITGSIVVILKDALKPNLVQTLDNTPVLIHGGPFANIAHGCNSIIATKLAMKLSDYVITEAGFGADLGAEKFLNIKSRVAEINPSCVVIVATIRALKMHGGIKKEFLKEENVQALIQGCGNLEQHIETIKSFNLPYVIAINKFDDDTDNEINELIKWCNENNHKIELSDVWKNGALGGTELAKTVIEISNSNKSKYKPLYSINDSIEKKISTIAKTCYGASGIEFSKIAKQQIEQLEADNNDKFAICMAKTPVSLSDDANLIGRPRGFKIYVSELRLCKGAKFIVVLTGKVMTMPGLPKRPSALNIDLIDDKITGLF